MKTVLTFTLSYWLVFATAQQNNAPKRETKPAAVQTTQQSKIQPRNEKGVDMRVKKPVIVKHVTDPAKK